MAKRSSYPQRVRSMLAGAAAVGVIAIATVAIAAGPAPTTRAAASRPVERPYWRLRAGANPELQLVVDQERAARASLLKSLDGDVSGRRDQISALGRVVRMDKSQRDDALARIAEYRSEIAYLEARRDRLSRNQEPAVAGGAFRRAMPLGPDGRRRMLGRPGSIVCAHEEGIDGTVVERLDAHRAVVVPTLQVFDGFQIHDPETMYVWASKKRKFVEGEPIIVKDLPALEGKAVGARVRLAGDFLVRTATVEEAANSTLPYETMEYFTLDAFEPIPSPATRAATRPATRPTTQPKR